MSRGIPERKAGRAQLLAIDVPLIAAMSAIPVVFAVAHLPTTLLLPGIAVLAFSIATITAALGWHLSAERRGGNVTIFDFSGACILIGIAAGMFSDPHRVSQFFGVAIASP